MNRQENSATRIILAGDSSLLVQFQGDDLLRNNRLALMFERRLQAANICGLGRIVATISSVLVQFDPLTVRVEALEETLQRHIETIDTDGEFEATRWVIPACYGGEYGPDLANIADAIGCSEVQAAEQHGGTVQRVLMLGFAPGFCYAGLLPDQWSFARLDKVKPQVPAGSISVAIAQTVMTATADPTGWHTVARTPFINFDPTRWPPVSIRAGDEIVYQPISSGKFAALAARAEKGRCIVQSARLQ